MPSANITPTFWQDRRVFITGHTGFKGGWLSQWLCDMGAIVKGYALAPDTTGIPQDQLCLFDILQLREQLIHIEGDIRDRMKLKAEVTAFMPEIIIHMAAQPLVRESYSSPVETYETNVLGTVHLLDACRDLKNLKVILNVTSDKCYENREVHSGYVESDPMGGHDPYSASKGCAELITASYRHSFFPVTEYENHGVCLASARAGNVIGGGDWSPDRLFPDTMRSLEQKQSVLIRNPSSIRPWQHVLEPLRGYLLLAEYCLSNPTKAAKGWNFGPKADQCISVGEIMNIIKAYSNDAVNWHTDEDDNRVHEANLLRLNCDLAHNELFWHPKLTIEQMIALTYDWYKEQDIGEKKSLITNQIKMFGLSEC